MLKNGIFWTFLQNGSNAIFIFHFIVEDNGADHLRHIVIFRKVINSLRVNFLTKAYRLGTAPYITGCMTMKFLPDFKLHGEMQNLQNNWNNSYDL